MERKKLTRHEMREGAFLLIFQFDNGQTFQETLDANRESFELEAAEFTVKLASGVLEHLEEIDTIISKFSPKRTVDRIPKVSLAILRLAIFELSYCPETPLKVAVNEALEICSEYSEQKDKAFINGVLGSYIRSKQEFPFNSSGEYQ